MPELVVETVQSANALRRALSPGGAAEFGVLDGDRLTVDDHDTAADLVERHPNVRWADDEPPTPESETPRMDVDGEETTYTCGVNGCSREVDSPTDRCWQHAED